MLQDISSLTSLKISSGGTKFAIFREHVGYLHFVLLRWAKLLDKLLQVYAAFYHGCHIDLFLVLPEIAVAFLAESCKSVLESWHTYVSSGFIAHPL